MYFAAPQEVQFDDAELYMYISIWRDEKHEAGGFLEWEGKSESVLFCRLTSEKLIQVESSYNQTPLNYANPHAQVIVSSLPHLSPTLPSFPMRTQRRIKGAWRNVMAGSYFDILKNLFLF